MLDIYYASSTFVLFIIYCTSHATHLLSIYHLFYLLYDWFHSFRKIPDYVIISYDCNRGIPSFYFYTRNFKKKFLRYKYIFSFSGVGPYGWYRYADSRPDDRFSSIFNLFGGPTSWDPGILGTTSPYTGVLPSPARLLLILLFGK